jgi:hypothetical protein
MRVVFDTSVLVAAARSRQGASFALVNSIPAPEFQLCLSVGLYAEWQQVLTRPEHLRPGGTADDARLFCATLPARRTCRQFISFGGQSSGMRTMTWYWNWLLRHRAAIL